MKSIEAQCSIGGFHSIPSHPIRVKQCSRQPEEIPIQNEMKVINEIVSHNRAGQKRDEKKEE